jgi:chromate transporter
MKKTLLIFWTFFKIGAFTFGGGFAMIPLIEREIVHNKKWISQRDMVDIITISQSFPGAVAINSAIFVGKRIGRAAGVSAAALGIVLPSFLIITFIASIFSYLWESPFVIAAFSGINSAVVALLAAVSYRFAKASIRDWVTPFITIAALLLLFWARLHPIYVIFFGIGSGIIFHLVKRQKNKS